MLSEAICLLVVSMNALSCFNTKGPSLHQRAAFITRVIASAATLRQLAALYLSK